MNRPYPVRSPVPKAGQGRPAPDESEPAVVEAPEPVEPLYRLRPRDLWTYFWSESLAYKMMCAYLIVEYVRPQSIISWLDALPWGQLTLITALIAKLMEPGSKTLVRDAANAWLILFNIVIIFSAIFAIYPEVSMGYLRNCYLWAIIYFLIINIVNTERRLLFYLLLFLLCGAKLSFSLSKTWALRGFAFTTWGLQGPPGYFFNSGELSIQMLMFGPLALFLWFFLRPYLSKWTKRLLLLIPITAAMVVIGASSRGSQLALAVQTYPTLIKGRLSFRNLLLTLIVIAGAVYLLPDAQKARFTSAGDDNTSIQRLLYWKHGVEMLKEHPVLGVGYYNFPAYYTAHWPQDILFGVAQLPHNIFVQVGTDAGLLGLGCFGALILQTMLIARRVRKLSELPALQHRVLLPAARGLHIAMWGFLIAGQFVTVTYYPFFWINLAMMVATGNVARQMAAR